MNALNALAILSYNNQCPESLRLRSRIVFGQADFELGLSDSAVSSLLFELERAETSELTRDPTLVKVRV